MQKSKFVWKIRRKIIFKIDNLRYKTVYWFYTEKGKKYCTLWKFYVRMLILIFRLGQFDLYQTGIKFVLSSPLDGEEPIKQLLQHPGINLRLS